ncbi:NHL repeat-containing protein [Actinoplanes sp. RD1]|uniref:hypothetical protein n=1 Tax=Actinoplanes sp. RD1 TaxID=3064538 RepID=UPI002740FBD4|nr:hypothetical protein [Actinoplanes sp. RD1]
MGAAIIVGTAVALLLPAAPAAPAPVTVCTIKDDRLDELSGLAATPDGYVAVNDGSDHPSHRRIFFLDSRCAVQRTVKFPDEPTDTEDLAVAPDGTVWIGDIGDNGSARKSIGLWKLAPGALKPVSCKLSYPNGAHNAETLVLDGDGTPIVITKEPFAGDLYVPDGELCTGKSTPLRAAGSVRVPVTTTPNPYDLAGHLVLTGGTNSPDGTKVALRTYADAFEFPVVDGDVIGALTSGSPASVALPDEPQGEAVAYARDGSSLLTASEGTKPALLRYPSALRTTPPPPPSSPPPSSAAAVAPRAAEENGTRGFFVVAVAALLVAALAGGIAIARRR